MSIFYSSYALISQNEFQSPPIVKFAPSTDVSAALSITYPDDKLYANSQIEISNIYPNPANDIVKFSYTLLEPTLKAKITIRNVLGSVIAEEELSHETKQLDIHINEYTAGMYFYTLSINGKSVITKKFLVKR